KASEKLNDDEQWRQEYLTDLVRSLEAFDDPDPHVGVVADVRKRLEIARTIEKRSIEEFAGRWRDAIESIADRTCNAKYRGLQIRPQIGLVPLGQNLSSQLWEFAVLDSGRLPKTDGRTSDFQFENETAIVVVLLPGGTFPMGSAEAAPDRGDD